LTAWHLRQYLCRRCRCGGVALLLTARRCEPALRGGVDAVAGGAGLDAGGNRAGRRPRGRDVGAREAAFALRARGMWLPAELADRK